MSKAPLHTTIQKDPDAITDAPLDVPESPSCSSSYRETILGEMPPNCRLVNQPDFNPPQTTTTTVPSQTMSAGSSRKVFVYRPNRKKYQISSVYCFFGAIHIDSWTDIPWSTSNDPVDIYKTDQRLSRALVYISPSKWLANLGIRSAFHLDISNHYGRGWQVSLQSSYLVPDNSLIFKLCLMGDLDGVRSLFMRGQASVRDTDSMGRTPLHVSIIDLPWMFLSTI